MVQVRCTKCYSAVARLVRDTSGSIVAVRSIQTLSATQKRMIHRWERERLDPVTLTALRQGRPIAKFAWIRANCPKASCSEVHVIEYRRAIPYLDAADRSGHVAKWTISDEDREASEILLRLGRSDLVHGDSRADLYRRYVNLSK